MKVITVWSDQLKQASFHSLVKPKEYRTVRREPMPALKKIEKENMAHFVHCKRLEGWQGKRQVLRNRYYMELVEKAHLLPSLTAFLKEKEKISQLPSVTLGNGQKECSLRSLRN